VVLLRTSRARRCPARPGRVRLAGDGRLLRGALTDDRTFCPYKSLASYYDIGERKGAAWSHTEAWPEVARIGNHVSFEPDKIGVYLDGRKLALEPGQTVIPHGIDRGLDPDEVLGDGHTPARV
jgi:hypothetical protein